MGLPALDMPKFEEVGERVVRAPRVVTTIFSAPNPRQLESEEEHRNRITGDVDLMVRSVTDWRQQALVGLAHMRGSLNEAIPYTSLDGVRFASGMLQRLVDELRVAAVSHAEEGDRLIVVLSAGVDEAAKYSVEGGRFLRRELKRLVQANKLRLETSHWAISRMVTMKEKVDAFIADNAVASPPADEAGQAGALERSRARASDIADVEARTERLLRVFPKTAAYLAR